MLCHVFLRPRWLPCGPTGWALRAWREDSDPPSCRPAVQRCYCATGAAFPARGAPSLRPAPARRCRDLEPVPRAVLMLGPPLQLRAPERRSSDAGVRPQGSRKVPLRRSLRGEGKVHPTRKEIAGRQALRGEHLTPAIAKEGEAGAGAARAPPAEGGRGVELVGGRHRKRPH